MRNKSIWMMGVVMIVLIVLAAVFTVVIVSNQKTSAPKSSSDISIETAYHPADEYGILILESADARS